MLSAKIDNRTRKAVYARDGYRCALCDSTQYIQVHHVIPRSEGGTNSVMNLITLCGNCHSQAHGVDLYNDLTAADMNQFCIEYLADHYAPRWNPWGKDGP